MLHPNIYNILFQNRVTYCLCQKNDTKFYFEHTPRSPIHDLTGLAVQYQQLTNNHSSAHQKQAFLNAKKSTPSRIVNFK